MNISSVALVIGFVKGIGLLKEGERWLGGGWLVVRLEAEDDAGISKT